MLLIRISSGEEGPSEQSQSHSSAVDLESMGLEKENSREQRSKMQAERK